MGIPVTQRGVETKVKKAREKVVRCKARMMQLSRNLMSRLQSRTSLHLTESFKP